MKIELKNIKLSDFASQETRCFEATVYIDGKKAGTVSNEGHGGPHNYSPWEVAARISGYAETLPPWTYQYEGVTHSIPQNADMVLDDILTEALYARDLKRAMSRKILFRDNTGVLKETKPMTKERMAVVLKMPDLAKQLNAEEVLNLIPFNRALTIYTSHAGY